MNRPPRSLHLPARNPSSWTYFVVRDRSSLRGLCPPSWGAPSALRVARSRAARIPVETRVRRRLLDETRLRRGDARGVEALVDSESRRGVRARARAPELLSRPESDVIGLDEGPTPSASMTWRQCGSPRGLALRATFRSRSHPAACLEPKYAAVSEIQNILESWNRFSAEHNSMRVVRRPPYFTSMFSDERSSEEICKYFTDVLLSAEF